MLRIGLVGGMTPESTKDYYNLLIEMSRERLEGNLNNPEIIIYSVNLQVMVDHMRGGRPDKVVDWLVDVVEKLRLAGAEIGAMTANTPHVFFGQVSERTTLPLVNIIETTYNRALTIGSRKVLLLGTATTMASDMYPRRFEAGGIEVVVPDEEERNFINGSIENELSVGVVRPGTKTRYVDICKRYMKERDVDTVILGCTEIPMVLKEGDIPLKTLDTLRIHAEAIFERAMEG
jgi:aspartate racemase